MCFSVSSTFDAVYNSYLKEKILTLGGTVVCEQFAELDVSCTHLICSEPKIRISIYASGRWLLCPAYIEDSFEAGHFLNVIYLQNFLSYSFIFDFSGGTLRMGKSTIEI